MPASEQENDLGPAAAALGGFGHHRSAAAANCAAPPTGRPPPPFRFRTPRALIDWRALRALDLDAVARDTDLDALESVLEVVAQGDLDAEDARALPFADVARLFRAAQLTVDYLLYVQDRLAADGGTAAVRGGWA